MYLLFKNKFNPLIGLIFDGCSLDNQNVTNKQKFFTERPKNTLCINERSV